MYESAINWKFHDLIMFSTKEYKLGNLYKFDFRSITDDNEDQIHDAMNNINGFLDKYATGQIFLNLDDFDMGTNSVYVFKFKNKVPYSVIQNFGIYKVDEYFYISYSNNSSGGMMYTGTDGIQIQGVFTLDPDDLGADEQVNLISTASYLYQTDQELYNEFFYWFEGDDVYSESFKINNLKQVIFFDTYSKFEKALNKFKGEYSKTFKDKLIDTLSPFNGSTESDIIKDKFIIDCIDKYLYKEKDFIPFNVRLDVMKKYEGVFKLNKESAAAKKYGIL